MDSKVSLKHENPHNDANLLSKLFLTWSFKYFYRAYRKGITVESLCRVKSDHRSSDLADRLEQAWEYEVKQAKEHNSIPSLTKAIVRTFWLECFINGLFLGLLNVLIWPFIPYTLAMFIAYFSGERNPETYKMAHITIFLMNLLSLGGAMMMNHLVLTQGSVGMKVRISCCSLVYRKILRLGPNGMAKTEPGQVINILSNDVNRFDMASLYLNYIWVTPIAVPTVCYLVWQHIGIATLAALAVVVLQTTLVQVYLSNRQGVLRGKIAERTDERVKVMSELVTGVQVIKMYVWEKSFEKVVNKLRKLEVKFVMRTSIIKGIAAACSVFTERFILFAGIVTFVFIGGDIRPEITFSLAQYFNIIQAAASICLPFALSTLAEAKVSVRRIQEFMLLDELKEENNNEVAADIKDKADKEIKNENKLILSKNLKAGVLSFTNVSATWNSESSLDTLRNINLYAVPGEFIGVAGLVGSGKSSLLQVILGELPISKGSLSLGGARVSYASQEPWLFVATVRQNILFGLPYDRIRYKKVVQACSLTRDFEQWPAGDSTLVGERGISLSGGQRARIGLARACYRQADIYLLDDPLSAVDTHVGKHLVSECVMGLLRHTTRILVTHQLHHLKGADKIIILHHGEIEAEGSFDEVSSLPLFNELLKEIEDTENEPVKLFQQRTLSVQSQTNSIGAEGVFVENAEEADHPIEMIATGRVPLAVYAKYFRSGSGFFILFTALAGIIVAQVVTSFSDLWLTRWMNAVESEYTILESTDLVNTTGLNKEFERLNKSSFVIQEPAINSSLSGDGVSGFFELPQDYIFYIYIWAAAILGCIILTTARSIMFFWVCMRSSIKLHNQMFSNILAATMRFFDTNPSGLILNRFSKDMGVVDEILPRTFLDSIQVFMVMIGILVMVAIVTPYMLITTAVCGFFMILWTVLYLNTAQALKRVEGVTRSPVFSHVSATMAGLSTVRANGAQQMLCAQFDDKQDVHTSAWYLTLVTNAAFTIWLSIMCATYVVTASYTLLLLDDGTTQSGNVGLVLSQGLILVNMVQFGIKQATEVVTLMTSVERVQQFTSLPKESIEGPSPPKKWPQSARLIFKDLSLRYDKDSDPVLKKLNFEIESGWKVGVVGRTGAGKSSLISALFRLAPLEGHIFIDDIDSGKIALKDLRSIISIIPQEPVLFSATLRYNLDPFDKYSDAELWEALEQVELKSSVTSLSEMVASGGSNFSAGQRQLLCLARAALGRNKLLVLDEATANVDPNTDALIQKSIRKHFTECTVITVAHRLHTVADSDRVVVMDAGEIVECGHPHILLQQEGGHFASMVNQLGPAAEQSLRELAATAYSQSTQHGDGDK